MISLTELTGRIGKKAKLAAGAAVIALTLAGVAVAGGPNDTAFSGPSLTAGVAQQGALAAGDDQGAGGQFEDGWTFTGRRGQVITIDMRAEGFDGTLELRSPSGQVRKNDDSRGGLDPRVTWVLPKDGAYSARVSSYKAHETGNYALRMVTGQEWLGGSAAAGQGKVFALLVGVSDYEGESSDLPNTDKDAEALAQTLRASVSAETMVLTNANATRERVAEAFKTLAAQAGPNDTFLFFFSGHGGQREAFESMVEPDGKDETLVLYDGEVSDDELAVWYSYVHARTALVALDSCFSGGFARDVVSRNGVMGLFSSQEDLTSAVAREFEAGGYLAAFVRDAMSGIGDADQDGVVTAGELSDYVQARFTLDAQGVASTTRDKQDGTQVLVVERGGVRLDAPLLRRG